MNHLAHEISHESTERSACDPIEERYRYANGIIVQCCHCRRTQRSDGSAEWDWVLAWVGDPPRNASGGLCLPCFRSHYARPPRRPPGAAGTRDRGLAGNGHALRD